MTNEKKPPVWYRPEEIDKTWERTFPGADKALLETICKHLQMSFEKGYSMGQRSQDKH
jgi:hypothetical protein